MTHRSPTKPAAGYARLGAATILVLVLGAAEALAQDRRPPEAGPIWGWREHATPRAAVQAREEARGETPDRARARRDAEDVDRLYRELLGPSPRPDAADARGGPQTAPRR